MGAAISLAGCASCALCGSKKQKTNIPFNLIAIKNYNSMWLLCGQNSKFMLYTN